MSVQIEEAGSVQLDKSQNAEWKERSSTSTGRDAARSINSRRERGPDKLTVNSNARSKQSISVAESDDIEVGFPTFELGNNSGNRDMFCLETTASDVSSRGNVR